MNFSYYKYCVVPQCKSTTIKTPNKLFIYVPNNEQIRRKWLEMARRQDAHILSTDSTLYFCEDHFDLENDMENYMQYKIMGSIKRIQMKSNCIPSRFDCWSDRNCSPTPTDEQIKDTKETVMIPLSKDTEHMDSLGISTCFHHGGEWSPNLNSKTNEKQVKHKLQRTDGVPGRKLQKPVNSLNVVKQNSQQIVIKSTCKISTEMKNSVKEPIFAQCTKQVKSADAANKNIKDPHNVVKYEIADIESMIAVNKGYDEIVMDESNLNLSPDEFNDYHDFVDHVVNYKATIRGADLNVLGNECIKQEYVKPEHRGPTENSISVGVKTENNFRENINKIMIKQEIESTDFQETGHIGGQSLHNERKVDYEQDRDFNLDNLYIKKEMVEYEQIYPIGSSLSGLVENKIEFEEFSDNKIIKKEILFVNVNEDNHVVDDIYSDKKIEKSYDPVIMTKKVKTNAQRQKEYRMRKRIEKLLICPKKLPKTNAQRQQEYRENRKKMQLSEELNITRKKMNAERAKRYRANLKLKKQQFVLNSSLSSIKEFSPA